jgi:uncharacterized radical SAM superfamily Fe-S cluster-containing enzyme
MIQDCGEPLGTTTSRCGTCGEEHRAFYTRDSGRVKYVVECPVRPTEAVVSGDDRIYSTVRWGLGSGNGLPPQARRWHFFQVAVTDRCTAECPLCYAEADRHGNRFLSADEFRERAMHIRRYGGIRISLTGGEPTSHPELPELIRIARHECGLMPTLVTNGHRFAHDPTYLHTLKRAGLTRVQLQFDTFDDRTYEVMRGRRDCAEKLAAVDRIVAARMKLGLIATVCDRNLPEVGALLLYARSLAPVLRTLIFQPMVMVGRLPAGLATVSAEEIIRTLVERSPGCDLNPADFRPFPRLENGHTVHPSCSVHALLCGDGERTWAIRQAPGPGRASGAPPPAPSGALLQRDILRKLRHRGAERTRRHAFLISILSFMYPLTRDEERVKRCIVASVGDRGFEGLCEKACNELVRHE